MPSRIASEISELREEIRAIKQRAQALDPHNAPKVRRATAEESFIEFNELVGWPRHPLTNKQTKMFDYQIHIGSATERFILVNKARKIGISETGIRRFAWKAREEFAGYQVLFISQSQDLSELMMQRYQDLFLSSELSAEVEVALAGYTKHVNGCEVFSRPASNAGGRSFDRVKGILLDEFAHYGLLDDRKVYAAARPAIINTKGELMGISTPKGQRGVFYDLFTNDDSFRKWTLPYFVAPGLIATEEIEQEKKSLGDLFAQEYECAFLSVETAAIPPGLVEANEEDYEPEDLDVSEEEEEDSEEE